MALSGNKGEWSEIYTLFRILGEGKIHAGDANMEKLDLYYPIINVIRKESKRYEYKPDVDQHIVVVDEEGVEYARISMDRFMQESASLLKEIRSASKSAFEIPSSETFMNMIGCRKLKAPSSDKADIHIVIHDLRTGMTPNLGFSIKSQLGQPSTLINSNISTNVLYRVDVIAMTDIEMDDINSIKSHRARIKAIYERGGTLSYTDIEHSVFKNNLLFLDCCMPRLVGECLLLGSISDSMSNIRDIVETIAVNNPLNYSGNNVLSFYEHKMKVLLIDAALGMTPAKEWNGRYDANGGYIIVRKDGEIVCYHFYNRNDVEDYLYNNTFLERASRRRYKYGQLFRGEDGGVYIRLNLQIRFRK